MALIIGSITLSFISFISGLYWLFFAVFFTSSLVLVGYCIFMQWKLRTNVKDVRWITVWLVTICASIIIVVARNFALIEAWIAITLLIASALMIVAAIFVLVWCKAYKINFSVRACIEYFPMIVLLFFLFILSMDSFSSYASFDGREYFSELQHININTFNDAATLSLARHLTFSYSIPVYILSCLVGNLYNGAILFNILSLMLGTIAFYRIIKRLCPNCYALFAYLCTAVFMFSPFTFGMAGYVFVQTSMMYGALFFLLACLTKSKTFMFITSLYLMFTFDMGILITAMLLFLPVIASFVKALRSKNWDTIRYEIKNQLNVFNICAFALHVLFVVLYLVLDGWGTGGVSLSVGFSIRPLLSVLLLNFNWLFVAIIIGSIIKCRKGTYNKDLTPIISVLLLLVVFNSILITHNHPRYYLVHFVCLYILAFCGLHHSFKNFKLKTVAGAVFANFVPILMLPLIIVQSYFTIDPVMLLSQHRLDTGNGAYVVNATDLTEGDIRGAQPRFSDGYFYNKQMNHFDMAFDGVLKTTNYNSLTDAIIVTYDLSGGSLSGRAYDLTPSDQAYGWDATKGRRYDTFNDDEKIKYFELGTQQQIVDFINAGEYTNYWFLDYAASLAVPLEDLPLLKAVDGEEHRVEYYGWGWDVSKIILA